jgi:hypothetical protein
MPPQKAAKNVHGNAEDLLPHKSPLHEIVQELTQDANCKGNGDLELSTKGLSNDDDSQSSKRSRIKMTENLSSEPGSTAPIATPTGFFRQCSPVLLSVTPGLNSRAFTYASAPPSTTELLAGTDYYGIPSKIYRSPHYSKEIDASEKPREYAGLLYYLQGGNGLAVLEDWDHGSSNHKVNVADVRVDCTHAGWEFASSPPSVREAKKWLNSNPKGVIKPFSKLNSQVNQVLLNFRA